MTGLLLIRHGRTEWNETGRIQGQHDSPLTEEARVEVATWRLPDGYDSADWIASPLGRTLETARLLGHEDAALEPLLKEMSWGDWEGLVLSELRRDLGEEMASLEARGLEFRPPAGESPRDLQIRLRPLLQRLGRAGRDTVAVTHKGVVRAIYALSSGWDMIGPPPVKLRNNVAQEFLIDPDGRPTPGRLNIALAP